MILGTLLVEAGKDIIAAVVQTIAGWVGSGRSRSVMVQLGDDKIEISDPTADDQRRLIESFLARHVEEAP
jgi:hypothetical protein